MLFIRGTTPSAVLHAAGSNETHAKPRHPTQQTTPTLQHALYTCMYSNHTMIAGSDNHSEKTIEAQN